MRDKADQRSMSAYNMSVRSDLSPEEVHLLCLNTSSCFSFDQNGTRFYLHNKTRLEASGLWDEVPGSTFYDIYYATRGKFDWNKFDPVDVALIRMFPMFPGIRVFPILLSLALFGS